jgi:hypothetical protein
MKFEAKSQELVLTFVEGTCCHATLIFRMHDEQSPNPPERSEVRLWCPNCAREVNDPLVCGDCSAVICRICGTPLESADELAFG